MKRAMIPRPHQQEAVDRIVDVLDREDRAQAIMACGSGKTLMGLWVAEQRQASRVLVLVPSLALVRQLLEEWRANARTPFRHLVICSDQSVDEVGLEGGESSVTTDLQEIHAFLQPRLEPGDWQVVVSTYHSSPKLSEAQRLGAPGFDLAICDEAHWTAGPANGPYKTILSDEGISTAKRLFMTATPKIGVGADEEHVSMDDEEIFGVVAFELPFSEAIDLGLLVDFEVLVLGIDAPADPGPDEFGVVALERTLKRARRVVTYHNTVLAAEEFAIAAERCFEGVPVRTINGATPAAQRAEVLRAFREARAPSVLTNCRCLTEGVDVPGIDAIVFVQPRRSVIEIAQALGRALRLAAGKTKALVVVPVLIPPEASTEDILAAEGFDSVVRVLRALRAHDERLVSEVCESVTTSPGMSDKTRVRLDFPMLTGLAGEELSRKIYLRVLHDIAGDSSESWRFALQLEALRAAVLRNRWSKLWSLDRALYGFAYNQASALRRGKLSADRQAQLEGIPGWREWSARLCGDSRWSPAFERLVRDLNTSGLEALSEQPNRGYATRLRKRQREGQLCDQKVQLLQAIPAWREWCRPKQDPTGDFIAQVHRAVATGGWDGLSRRRLKIWRRAHQLRESWKCGALSPGHRARLEAIPGWIEWCTRLEASLDELEAVAKAAGWDGLRGQSKALYERASKYRRAWRAGALDADVRGKLESIPGWLEWCEPPERRWVAAIRDLVARDGWGHMWRSHRDYERAHRLRAAWREGTLDPDIRSELEAISGWTEWCMPRGKRRDHRKVRRLEETVRDAGWPGLRHRSKCAYENALGFRRSWRAGELDDEIRVALEGIPGWEAWCRGEQNLRKRDFSSSSKNGKAA